MKKLVFNRALFIRHPEEDFEDDGTKFRVYFYKDKLPISATNGKWGAYVAIRLDYLGIRWETYKEDWQIMDEFNGVENAEQVDMEKLIENCEYILNKYVCKKQGSEDGLKVGDMVMADGLVCEILEINECDGELYYDVTPAAGYARGFTRTFTAKELRKAEVLK